MHRGHRRTSGALLYKLQSYSCEAGSQSELGIMLAASNPQGSPNSVSSHPLWQCVQSTWYFYVDAKNLSTGLHACIFKLLNIEEINQDQKYGLCIQGWRDLYPSWNEAVAVSPKIPHLFKVRCVEPGTVAQACNPRDLEVETGGLLRVWGQILSPNRRLNA